MLDGADRYPYVVPVSGMYEVNPAQWPFSSSNHITAYVQFHCFWGSALLTEGRTSESGIDVSWDGFEGLAQCGFHGDSQR